MIPKVKQKLFIYERREMFVLTLIGVFGLLFLFTLGVHWAKKLNMIAAPSDLHQASAPVEVADEKVPDFQERADLERVSLEEVDQVLTQNLQEEVERTGIRLEVVRPLSLPQQQKALAQSQKRPPAQKPAFSLQVGAFQSLKQAEVFVDSLRSHGLKAQIHSVQHQGKVNYRVYLGEFSDKKAALQKGKLYQNKKWIKSFTISNRLAH